MNEPNTHDALKKTAQQKLEAATVPAAVALAIAENLARLTGDDGVPTELTNLANARQLAGGKLALFNGQFAGVPLNILFPTVKAMGFLGIEICTWGPGGLDVRKAAGEEGEQYCTELLALAASHDMSFVAVSDHINCQGLGDAEQARWPGDERLKGIVAPHLWPTADDVNPVGSLRTNVQNHLGQCALAASRMKLKTVNGFIGSQVWHKLFDFPPRGKYDVQNSYTEMAILLVPVLRVFKKLGVRFALEVHPTELVYSNRTARDFLAELKRVCAGVNEPDLYDYFGFCMDPSHFQGQGLDPVEFILEFAEKIFNFHAKDVGVYPGPTRSSYGDHLRMGTPGRHWNFMSGGRGSVDWAAIACALIHIGYTGPIAVEWEQFEMVNWFGLYEACQFFRQKLFYPISQVAFDAAFAQGGTTSGNPRQAEFEEAIKALRTPSNAE